jgi:localization factor PodJL
MKIGVPWSVKGIKPEARETAKEAARRAGMPLSEWLNTVILNSAAQQELDDHESSDHPAATELGAVNARLDALSQRLERLTRGPEAYAPPHMRAQLNPPAPAYGPPPAYAPAPAYVPPPYVQSRPAERFDKLETAVAEIAARRRALSAEAAPAPVQPEQRVAQPAPVESPPLRTAPPVVPLESPATFPEPPAIVRPQPVPAQDLSGLEEQLRQITDRIDTLRSPGVEQAISALRDELAAIAHSLNEAMPRQAIEAIERQIKELTLRIAEGRQNGGDAFALANLERGLAEVRETLRNLTPAESLAGCHDAIELLGQKIDYIVAQRDPASLEHLENTINTLRQISTQVASSDAVARLASDVQMLAEKVDRIAHAGAGDALNGIEARIAELSDSLAQRSPEGATVPQRLEALVDALSDQIERLQNAPGGEVAFGHLENRIVKLVEKLDASDSRLTHLEAIERGLADLLVTMETMRTQADAGVAHAWGDVSELKDDIVRTQTELQSVHGALSQIMDRLGQIEKGMSAAAADPDDMPARATFGRLATRAVPTDETFEAPVPSPSIAPAEPTAAAPPPREPPTEIEPARRVPRAGNLPSNPDLPPDLPLEPGSGPPRLRADPAARIAASEAALGDAIPPAGDAPQGKSGFLAAARRAAQTALHDTGKRKNGPRSPRDFLQDEPVPEKLSLRQRLFGRVKSLLIAASLIAIIVGGLHLGVKYLNLVEILRLGESVTQLVTADPVPTDVAEAEPAPTGNTASASAPHLPGMIPPSSPFGYNAGNPLSPMPMLPGAGATADAAPGRDAEADITGSVPRGPNGAPQGASTDELPTSIGGPGLRKAAESGDAAAAYEIGVRYAEGRGVAPSAGDAARWFERAARGGVALAQFRVGSLYEKGIGVRKDLEKAKQAYLAAASQGNAKAMHNLAVLYAEGTAGKPDYDNAVKWFRKAAGYGVSDSQYNLGVLCARGLGTPKDFAEAYKWFALAANNGDKDAAKKRDDVGAHLDARTLTTVQAAVKAWVAQRQPSQATTITEPAGGWDAKPASHQTRTSALGGRR